MNGTEFNEDNSELSWQEFRRAVQVHGISNLAFYALRHFKIPVMAEVAKSLKLEHEDFIGIEALQELEIQNLIDIYESEGIDCMPMKGYVLKNMYPLVDMREMCDVDLLIKEKDSGRVREIMEENGFSFSQETPHEYVYKKGEILNIELHKCIVPPYNKTLYGYYGDGWSLAKKQSGKEHIYEMGMEDFYVYNFVHAAKHYLNSGIGIRQVLDLWVIKHKNPDMDFSYINTQLEKLGLSEFRKNMDMLIARWFDGEEVSEDAVLQMEEYILKSGVRGSRRQEKISGIYRNSTANGKGRLKVLTKALFPSITVLGYRYPGLKKCPLLYPFCWIHRLVHDMLFDRNKLKNKYSGDGIGDTEVEEFAKHCSTVGIKGDL